jgi:hypothetical protein
MSSSKEVPPKSRISPDEWAVIAALLLALIVRVGIIKHVPW